MTRGSNEFHSHQGQCKLEFEPNQLSILRRALALHLQDQQLFAIYRLLANRNHQVSLGTLYPYQQYHEGKVAIDCQ